MYSRVPERLNPTLRRLEQCTDFLRSYNAFVIFVCFVVSISLHLELLAMRSRLLTACELIFNPGNGHRPSNAAETRLMEKPDQLC